MSDPCLHCGHVEDGHGTRYAALVGDHEYLPSHEPAPTAIPHPLGGVTNVIDPGDPVGERLQQVWATDPAPAEYPGDRLHYGRHIA
jgi:hypothetical protein